MSKNFFELAKHLGEVNNSLKSQVRWLEAANDLLRKQLLDVELENARLRGRNQGLEFVATDNYPMGEVPALPATASLPPPPRQV